MITQLISRTARAFAIPLIAYAFAICASRCACRPRRRRSVVTAAEVVTAAVAVTAAAVVTLPAADILGDGGHFIGGGRT
jgi:hypothetical protein